MRFPRILHASLVAALIVLVAGQWAGASVGPRWTDDQLVDLSEVVITGRVAGVSTGWDTTVDTIYTYVTIDVSEVFKGWVPERRIVIKQIGGVVDGVGLSVTGQPAFRNGEEVLLFLEVRPRDNTLYTTALWQGKWTLEGAGASRVALRTGPGDMDSMFIAAETRGFAAFRSAMLSQAGDQARRPSDRFIRVVPSEMRSSAGQPFVLIDPASPYRWTSSTLAVDYESTGQPGLAGGGLSEIGSAISRWNAAGSGIQLAGGSARAAKCTTSNEGSGRVVISFMDDCNEISNSGGTLAVGGAWYSSSGGGTVNGVAFGRATDGFIMNNDSATAVGLLTQTGCFSDIQLHELGHVLGLGHTTVSGAIMQAFINNSCSSAANNLNSDDVAGIQFIYPGTSTGTTPPSSAPTGVAVTVSGSTLTVTWNAVTADFASAPSAATSYRVDFRQTVGGAVLATVPSTSTSVSLAIPAGTTGTFIAQVTAINSAGSSQPSSPATFTIGGGTPVPSSAPGMPTLYTPTASGSTVTISWAPPTTGGAPTAYDIEAIVQATGQVYNVSVGNQTSAQFPGIAPGNFLVRIRARNASGASEWTPQQLLVVGVNLGGGALQVTLTWNTTNDMDLHVREPNGTHVYYANKVGTTATLDVDDTNGYGPENIFVREGQAAAGVYRFYIVSYSGSPVTTSTIRVRLRPGAANESSVTFTRTTSSSSSGVGYLVVDVNPLTGAITEVTGTIAADELPGDARIKAGLR